MPDQAIEYNSVSDIGDIEALIAQAGPDRTGRGRSVLISLPASEKESFEKLMENHNGEVVRRTNVPALLSRLRELAEGHYRQEDDGSFSVIESSEPSDRPRFGTFREALLEAREKERISPGNLTLMKFMMDSEGTDEAIAAATARLEQAGYADFSFLGSGTFTIAFRAHEQATNRARVIKFSGWGGEAQARGADIPDNIKPSLDASPDMPDDWFLFAFPEVLPLDRVADEIGRGTRITVNYKGAGSDEDTDFYKALGDIDIVHALFVNSMTEDHFASDTVEGNTALLPDGSLKAFDMGMIAHRDNHSLNPYDPEAASRHERQFGTLGASFRHLDFNGVPTDIASLQPERYGEFMPDDRTQDHQVEMA